MRPWSLVLLPAFASAVIGCGGTDRPGPRATTTAEAIVAPQDVAGSPAARVRGWPRAFCRVGVGDTREAATARMGPAVSTSISDRGRQDVWEHLEVELIAAYDEDGRVRKLKDGSGDSRLPCSARRTGDATLDAYAARYQRACRDALRTQVAFPNRMQTAGAGASSTSARERARSARRRDRVLARSLASISDAAGLMATATPPASLRSAQRRIVARLPSTAGLDAAAAALRAGRDPGPGIGISLMGLGIPEQLLRLAPTCDDLR